MKLRHLALLLVIGLSFEVAQAEEIEQAEWVPDKIRLNVFGTIGASYHNQDGLAYRRNQEQKDAVEANKWDFASDSLVGGQISYLFNDQFTSTLQVVSRNNAWGNYKPEVTAAFVKYAPVEAWQFRLGRIPMVLNLVADSRFVGYSYNNARAFPELFGLLASFDRYDGFDVSYLKPIASGVLDLRFNYGNVVGQRYVNHYSSSVEDSQVLGLVANWQTDNLELRVVSVQVDINNFDTMLGLANRLRLIGTPKSIQRANEIRDASDYKIDVNGATFSYDYNKWKLTVSGAQTRSGNFPSYQGENGLVMLAYRNEKLTPYGSFAYARFKPESRPLNLPANPALKPLIDKYNTAAEAVSIRQSTVSLGLRYDINEHYALKMQVDKINADSTPLILSSRSDKTDKDLTLFTIAVDFFY